MKRVSLASLAAGLRAAPSALEAAVKLELSRFGAKVRDEATEKFGHYQPAVGPYPGWAPLADETIERKAKAGGAEDPLIGHYPKGEKNEVWPAHLRTTIQWHVEGWVVAVGTRDPLGPVHEYGTDHVPPRPFLRPTAFQNEKYFLERMEEAWQEAVRSL